MSSTYSELQGKSTIRVRDGIVNPQIKSGEDTSRIRTIKLSLTSNKKESTESAYSFQLKMESHLVNVIGFKFVRLNYTYTKSTVVNTGFIQFENFPLGDVVHTCNDEPYVCSFPVIDGTGTVIGSFSFPSDYTIYLPDVVNKVNRFNIKVMKEDSTTSGRFTAMSELTYLQIEVDVLTIDNKLTRY